MLPRTLEPEVMDSPEEARDYDAMDHAAVNSVFVADFLFVWNKSNPILDVGTGTAQIPIELCRRDSTAHVVGIDLAEHMLKVGQDNVRRAQLENRIRLERRDAKNLPYLAGAFAAIISNSIIHHIPEPRSALAEMARVVKPDGLIFVRDLLRPANGAAVEELVKTYAGEANPHQKKMFGDSLRAALNLSEVRGLLADLGFDPAVVRQTSDRHWTFQGGIGSRE